VPSDTYFLAQRQHCGGVVRVIQRSGRNMMIGELGQEDIVEYITPESRRKNNMRRSDTWKRAGEMTGAGMHTRDDVDRMVKEKIAEHYKYSLSKVRALAAVYSDGAQDDMSATKRQDDKKTDTTSHKPKYSDSIARDIEALERMIDD
jgi:hypothetical protein